MKELIKDLTPPLLWRTLKKLRSTSIWEYAGTDWQQAKALAPIGWNAESFLAACLQGWEEAQQKMQAGTFMDGDEYYRQYMTAFAYSIARASLGKQQLSMLDWGGNLGAYNLFARSLLPGIEIDYHCKDMPLLAEAAAKLQPDAHFYSDDHCFSRTYDFVIASGALQYSENWQDTLEGLVGATNGYLLVNRVPITVGKSYIVSQAAYGTTYLGWAMDREALLECAIAAGAELIYEFPLSDNETQIKGATSGLNQAGFLFQVKP